MAPRVDAKAAVTKQPSFPDERIKALQALPSCPTSSIPTENPPKEIKEVQKTFPLPLDEHNLPVEFCTAGVERQLYGDGPWSIGTDFELTHTSGHTAGLVSLPYKPLKVLFTGDHFAISHSSELTIFEQYNKQSVRMQLNRVRKFLDLDFEWILPLSMKLDNIRKLLDLDFVWILPGQRRRAEFRDNQGKKLAMEAFLVLSEQGNMRAYVMHNAEASSQAIPSPLMPRTC